MADLDLDKMAAILFCLVRHNSNYDTVVISVISITRKHLQASILVSKSILNVCVHVENGYAENMS